MVESQHDQDVFFMLKTFSLALKGHGFVNPGPMVGCVIVKNGRIIGQGHYTQDGAIHAEIEALQSASEDAVGATMYVNLEPHAYESRNAPCTSAIIKAGIKRVVCATLDPNPKVQGQGVRVLRRAGVEVVVLKELSPEAQELNEAFFTYHTKKRPFVVLKWASSFDGKIATRTHDSKWISNESARHFARSLRGIYQGILVGINTVTHDNPHLGTRIENTRQPVRLILDSHLKISLKASVLRDNQVIIVSTSQANVRKRKQLEKNGFSVVVCGKKEVDLKLLLKELYKRNIQSILVEGGGEVLGAFVSQKLFDKVYIFQAPILIGGHEAVSAIGGRGFALVADAVKLKNVSVRQFEDNLLFTGYPV